MWVTRIGQGIPDSPRGEAEYSFILVAGDFGGGVDVLVVVGDGGVVDDDDDDDDDADDDVRLFLVFVFLVAPSKIESKAVLMRGQT